MSNAVVTEASAELLKECDSGVKMAIKSLDDIAEYVSDERLSGIIADSRKKHNELKCEVEGRLKDIGEEDEEPGVAAKSMAFLKTNVKMSLKDSEKAAADLITDGCNMGIKILVRCLNKTQDAEDDVKFIAGKLINAEEELLVAVRPFL